MYRHIAYVYRSVFLGLSTGEEVMQETKCFRAPERGFWPIFCGNLAIQDDFNTIQQEKNTKVN